MRFLVDECTGPAVARWLRSESHEVFSVYEESPGLSDDEVLDMAHSENWILITNDKDFGEMIYRHQKPHRGVVFLRLQDDPSSRRLACMPRATGQLFDIAREDISCRPSALRVTVPHG